MGMMLDRRRYIGGGGKRDFSKEYLTFEALEDCVFTLTKPAAINTTYLTSVSYSVDGGETWTKTNGSSGNAAITTPTISAGNKVLWKGEASQYGISNSAYVHFSSTGNYKVYGNVMSLLDEEDFADLISLENKSYGFKGLFRQDTKLVDAENLVLPATTIATYCYHEMFYQCTGLVTAPKILPALALQSYCYQSMLYGCSSLKYAPNLPAVTLAASCYNSMFAYCSLLESAIELPAETTQTQCYYYMFRGCTSITSIRVLATNIASNAFGNWLNGVTQSGTIYKKSSLNLPSGASGVPSNWTVVEI